MTRNYPIIPLKFSPAIKWCTFFQCHVGAVVLTVLCSLVTYQYDLVGATYIHVCNHMECTVIVASEKAHNKYLGYCVYAMF